MSLIIAVQYLSKEPDVLREVLRLVEIKTYDGYISKGLQSHSYILCSIRFIGIGVSEDDDIGDYCISLAGDLADLFEIDLVPFAHTLLILETGEYFDLRFQVIADPYNLISISKHHHCFGMIGAKGDDPLYRHGYGYGPSG
ncbi:hypothetical protein [Methanothrix sp.]|uniref:hypothetical protein n=1 Tax=Methanothrix sp. TaxID=90426 RepID=UPI003C78E5BB